MAFDKNYWNKNYSEPDTMDGICNAKLHARYIKTLFQLDMIKIKSIADFGFGLGPLFIHMLNAFRPEFAYGIEPSRFAFKQFKENYADEIEKYSVKLRLASLEDWCLKYAENERPVDLGVCTSVLQYLPDENFEAVIEILSRKVRYLYLTVPTDLELIKQRSELDFKDNYAISRSQSFYLEKLQAHFTIISNRLLESKFFYDEHNTPFTEYLYRF